MIFYTAYIFLRDNLQEKLDMNINILGIYFSCKIYQIIIKIVVSNSDREK